MAMETRSWDFSMDILAEILLRLPPSSRRRSRLVCRCWQEVVNTRTAEMRSRPKPLIWNIHYPAAYVVDDLSTSSTGTFTQLWGTSDPELDYYENLQLVGTCNGLLCLCDNRERPGGALMVVNPATGETLALPPLPCAGLFVGDHRWVKWGKGYSFAYHPTTGRFKVVHVPCSYNRVCDFKTIHVFTLGEAMWREVLPGPGGAMCNLAAGIISVDGMTYWVKATAGGSAKAVSFDLKDDSITSTTIPLPVVPDHCRLSEVHGRLGFVACPDVWILEEGNKWSRRYTFGQCVTWPHFAYDEYILTSKGLSFYVHQPKDASSSGWRLTHNQVLRISRQNEGTLVANMTRQQGRLFDGNYRIFAYVQTTEPLSVYLEK